MTSDRDLLQALFAQQLGFAPASDVMAAGAQWLVQPETGASLGEVLQSRRVLDARVWPSPQPSPPRGRGRQRDTVRAPC